MGTFLIIEIDFSSSGGWKSKIKPLARLMSGEDSLLGSCGRRG
jgi:hypothetical protein